MIQPRIHRRPSRPAPATAVAAVRIVSRGHYLGDRDPSQLSQIGDASYYPLTDIQGTVWGYADINNAVVARWTYDAWGNVLDKEVSVPALARLRYRFQGREWSAATGLVHFRMRWYDPETGRWLSKDPIGLSGGLNLYAFCEGNAINCQDVIGTYPGDPYIDTPFGECLDGNKIINDIMLFYDAIDLASHKYSLVFKGPTSYIALFSLSGGKWGPCDFKVHEESGVYYCDEYYAPDEFGNYVAGFQAGYANVSGLLTCVKIGGWVYSAFPRGEPIGDAQSRPMIERGYREGIKKRK